jgi:hypothetical protein
MKEIEEFIIIIAIISVFIAIGMGMWQIKRHFNYIFGYSSQVEETVKKMVKKECLND